MSNILDEDFDQTIHFNVNKLDEGKNFPVELTMAEMKSIINTINWNEAAKDNKYLRAVLSKLSDIVVAEDD